MFHVRIFTDSVSFTDISHFGVEGMRVTRTRGWLYQPCDVAIMYGLANPERGSLQGQLRNAIYREHKGPIVVVESSLLGRGFKPAMPRWLAAMRRRPARPRQVHPYFRVAIGGALGDDADFCAANSPADRWEFQQRELGTRPIGARAATSSSSARSVATPRCAGSISPGGSATPPGRCASGQTVPSSCVSTPARAGATA